MYLLLGYGKSNKSVEKYLLKQHKEYIIFDDYKKDIKFDLDRIKTIIKSNGINNDHNILKEARARKIEIISDLQFYFDVTKEEKSCLVTGSNGKTTIVSLLEKTLNNTIAIGNNSLALFDYLEDENYKILEVSSFMLENINYIKYKYNIVSNIYPTHLEHHSTFVNYIKCKLSFLKYLDNNDYVVYNKDDIILNRIINSYDVNKISVSYDDNKSDIYYKENYIYYHNTKVLNTNNLRLMGKHNIYNVMLVLGVLLNHPLKKTNYKNLIYQYTGEKYRIQIIYDDKFKIINDSKSTNFKALNVALNSFKENIVLIVGGMKRNDDFELLDKELYKIKKVYCMGENKEDFYNYFTNNSILAYNYNTLEDVINNLVLEESDILLFSPGSVSHDQFIDFEHRGEVFNSLIKNKYFF